MKKLSILFFVFLASLCNAQFQANYPLDVDESMIHWKGTYMFSFSEHKGIARFTKGNLITQNGHITGGSFEVDMTSITHPERGDSYGPIEHLKNEDFFDVAKFPTAQLVITEVIYFEDSNKHKMLGDLTIKGVTKPIEFWSTVDGFTKFMNARLIIDRTRWGITYNHKLKNEAISDAIEFDVNLQF